MFECVGCVCEREGWAWDDREVMVWGVRLVL